MTPSKTEIPNFNPELPDQDISPVGEYHGATSVEEWEPMPEPLDPLADLEITGMDASKVESLPFEEARESLSFRERLSVSGIGLLAVGETLGKQVKDRFMDIVNRYHTWKAGNKTEEIVTPPQPQETKSIVSNAARAKSEGDWMSYQRELLKFADSADTMEDEQSLSKDALRARVRRADTKVGGVLAGEESNTVTTLAEANGVEPREQALDLQAQSETDFLNIRREQRKYLNPEMISQLKADVDQLTQEAIEGLSGATKLTPEAKKLLIRDGVIKDALSKYFGVSPDELRLGEKVPHWLQDEVVQRLDESNDSNHEVADKKSNEEKPKVLFDGKARRGLFFGINPSVVQPTPAPQKRTASSKIAA